MTADILFLTEAGPSIGLGHLRRCLTLAGALDGLGSRCRFIVAGSLPRQFERGDVPIALSQEGLAAPAKAGRDMPDAVVIDSYNAKPDYLNQWREHPSRIVLLSDSPNCFSDADLVIDPALGRKEADYEADVPPGCGLLLGPSYALIRPEFGQVYGSRTRTAAKPEQRVMVAFGGTDPANVTLDVVRILHTLPVRLEVITTTASPHYAQLCAILAETYPDVGLSVDLNGAELAAAMAAADVCVGAGGGMSWERCAAGLPAITLSIAPNQNENLRSLAAAGACRYMGLAADVDPGSLRAAVAELLDDEHLCEQMSRAARACCDGMGALRAAAYVACGQAADGTKIWLRPARQTDAGLILRWQSEPGARRFARNPLVPAPAEHDRWFRARLEIATAPFAIIESSAGPCGFVRLDLPSQELADAGLDREISVMVAQVARGCGISAAAIRMAVRLEPGVTVGAVVDPENLASKRAFERAGFHVGPHCYIWSDRSDVRPDMHGLAGGGKWQSAQ